MSLHPALQHLLTSPQEGLLTVVVASFSYLWVYNYPSTAEFLTEEEREFVQYRLKYDSDATRDESFSWGAVLKAIKDPKVWLYGLAFHTISLPLYTLSLFLVCLVMTSVFLFFPPLKIFIYIRINYT